MVEEAIWLPAWSKTAGRWHEPVTRGAFLFATAVFLLFVYSISFFAGRSETLAFSHYLALGTAVLMLVNIIMPHLGATIAQRRYAPGLGTAILINLPLMSLFIRKTFQMRDLNIMYFAAASLLMLLLAVFLWPLLFKIGGRLFNG